MIVFVAGMSRSGSMWTYNVVRAIFETKGWSVLPREVPIDEYPLIKSALASEQKENEVYCIKTHSQLKSPMPTKHDVRIINNIRDVRDACLSFMRFMHADFEAGKDAMMRMMKTTDYYSHVFGGNMLSVRYEDLTSTPLNVLEKICGFLNIGLTEHEKKEILHKFDKSNIQKKLQELPKVESDERILVDPEYNSKYKFGRNSDGTYKTYEKATGFQSNHITSSGDGEWKTYFDKSKVEQIIGLSREWLLRYGYKV
jgi:hypothetical protein